MSSFECCRNICRDLSFIVITLKRHNFYLLICYHLFAMLSYYLTDLLCNLNRLPIQTHQISRYQKCHTVVEVRKVLKMYA